MKLEPILKRSRQAFTSHLSHINKVAIIPVVLLALTCMSIADSLTVSPDSELKSISEAIRIATPGSTILIEPGFYIESDVNIDKPLHLRGRGSVIVDGDGKDIFQIVSDGVEISGLRLQNVKTSYTKEHAAIRVYKSRDFSIHDNVLEDIFFGVLVERSHHGKVYDNTIKGSAKNEYNSGNGIHIWHSSNVEVSGNLVVGMRDGIYFEFVKESKIFGNTSRDNLRYGLHFMFSNNDEYYENVFQENGAGVAVMFSKFIKMTNNQFVNNWGSASYGLLLKEINDTEIVGNFFGKNTIAIKVEGSNRLNYRENTFSRNGWAVKVTGACYNNTFERNDFLSNAFDISYKGSMNDNIFSQNHWSEYTGYDLNKDGIGDIPYRPVKLFSYVVNRTPETIVLLRSLFVDIINLSEKVSPIFTPDHLIDAEPMMEKINDSDH